MDIVDNLYSLIVMNCCCYISINQHKIKIFGYPIKKIYRLVEKHLQATQPSKSNMTDIGVIPNLPTNLEG